MSSCERPQDRASVRECHLVRPIELIQFIEQVAPRRVTKIAISEPVHIAVNVSKEARGRQGA